MKKIISSTSLAILLFLLVAPIINAQTVYITKSGKKYHKSNCRYLNKSKISIDLSDALKKGYTACSVCKPQSTANKEVIATDTKTEISGQTTKEVQKTTKDPANVAVQCKGITKSGARCKRKTTNSNGYCYQHQDQVKKK